ncbi:MAG TPA: hypothetical protein VLC09_04420 [Polyangiaceae bacterium]|nr:hypothetical protein [Polyangiaceae bacterium]
MVARGAVVLACGAFVLACGGDVAPECGYATSSCGESATPDWTVSEVGGADARSVHDFPTYDNASCSGQAVIELDVAALNRPEVFLFRQILGSPFESGEECERSLIHVTVLRRLGSDWEVFDDYTAGGLWSEDACYVRGAGKLGPDKTNENSGYPYSWIDLRDVEAARVLVSAEVDCEALPIQVGLLGEL